MILWILFALFAAATAVVWVVRELTPVQGLTFISNEDLYSYEKDRHGMQLLDVRDQVDYIKHHVPGSINISMGRLPYVHESQLTSEAPVVILAENVRKTKKAARMLKRYGFLRIYAPSNVKAPWNCGCCCRSVGC
ncbi:rhodanese-like domain-containing protein [Paenibacillus donghaensis]|uniref:rhodanese-like domain-containing protein n=1 Tax=Paenibacillus TaxID=44249 RepID=UPI001883B95A|nr:rhodanese-like domain-containing protein [Paenibacillus donghaensis]MBE9914034.1 rhodanese-like domain-containing protein [Paenibacillus donghaensis]